MQAGFVAALLAVFSRKVRGLQEELWTIGVLRSTWSFFALLALILTAGGYIVQSIDPSITTIGDFFLK